MNDHPRAESVVVAEDHGALRDLIARLLTADGYRVSAHADGVAALAALAETSADLLVTDLGLPGLDGLALIEQARQRDPALTVLVITSSDATAAVAAANLGVNGYLTKPFGAEPLRSTVRRVLDRRQFTERLRRLDMMRAEDAARQEALRVIGRTLPHELNQPLTCIKGYAALLADPALQPDDVRLCAREIVAAADRLAERVQQLQDLAVYAVREYGGGNTVLEVPGRTE